TPTEPFLLSLHDALPIFLDAAVVGRSDPKQTEIVVGVVVAKAAPEKNDKGQPTDKNAYLDKITQELRALCREHLAPYEVPKQFRSEEHTSELQSLRHLVC